MRRDRIDADIQEQDELMCSSAKKIQSRLGQLTPPASFEHVWSQRQSLTAQSQFRSARKLEWRAAVSIFVIFIIISVTVFFSSPQVRASVAQFPFIKMLLKDGNFEDQGLSQIDKKQLGVPIQQSVTDHQIRFTMDEVFYDGVQIVLNYDVEYLGKKQKITEKDANVYYEYEIVGARPTMMSTHKFTIMDDHSFIGSTLIDAYQYLDGYQLRMKVKQIGGVKGDWSVTVPLSVVKTEPHTKSFFPNISFVVEGINCTVERITMTPVTTQVVIRTEGKMNQELNFKLRDNLQTGFQYAGFMGGKDKYIANFGPPPAINPHPDYVSLVINNGLIAGQINDQKEEVASLSGKFPIVFKGDQGGTVTITKIDYTEEGTTMYYEASDAANQQPFILLSDTNGEHFSTSQPVRISKDSFSFKVNYPKLDTSSPIQAKMYYNEYKPGAEPKEPMIIKIPFDWSNAE